MRERDRASEPARDRDKDRDRVKDERDRARERERERRQRRADKTREIKRDHDREYSSVPIMRPVTYHRIVINDKHRLLLPRVNLRGR